MKRRLVLAAAATMLAAPALAQSHAGHDHGGAEGKNAALVATALSCVRAGIVCLDHCYASFAAGDTSLAACARSVDEMMAVTTALAKLAGTGSANLPALAKVALTVCLECEKECRKHADTHATCKACADACAACAAECRKIAA